MDEAELTQALQADLNFFKVKVQVKHREDQLHILVSRSQKNDVDYTVIFDAVQNSLAQKHLSVETFTVYGRVFGSKQPEWHGNGELLKLADAAEFDRELDYVELTDALAEDGTIDLPEELASDISQDADLAMPDLVSSDLADSSRADTSDFDTPDDFDMPEISAPDDDFGMSEYSANAPSSTEDFGETASDRQAQPSTEHAASTPANGKKYVGAIALLGAVAVAGGGWFMFDRSAQEQKLAEAQAVVAKTIDPQQLGKLDALQEAQTQLKKAATLLEEIPNRPGSYYEQAQTQLQTLRPKLAEIDAKLNLEKPEIDKLENAKNLAKEASNLVQNPPHKSDVWQTAQNKWQEALKLIESIPPNSLASAEAKQKLELYRANYTTITAELQKQKQVDFAVTLWPKGVTPDLQAEIKQLKTSGLPQPQFIKSCISTIRPRLNTGELQQRGFQPDTFSKVFCEYVASVN
jgi:hypothetical protein